MIIIQLFSWSNKGNFKNVCRNLNFKVISNLFEWDSHLYQYSHPHKAVWGDLCPSNALVISAYNPRAPPEYDRFRQTEYLYS